MALLGNYSVLNKSLAQFTNGTATAGAYAAVTPRNYQSNGLNLNRYSTFAKFNATPVGYLPPYSFVLPITGGGLGSFNNLTASISETVTSLAAGINIDSAINGVITLTNAQLDQIANLVAAITGSITTTDAILAAVSALGASISASGTITTAQLGALVNLVSSFSGSINITSANDFATASMSADMSIVSSVATPAQIAQAVWDEPTSSHTTAGSTGKALIDAGSAGNPWSADIASNNTPGTFGWFVQKLLTVAKFLGLK